MSSGQDGLGSTMTGSHHAHGGSYGPVIGALFFIAAVTAGSLAVARYCVGAQAFYRTGYDLDAYVQRKFAVCLGTGRGKLPAAATRPVKKEACHDDLQPEGAEEVEASEPPAEEEEEESAAGAATDP